jgi:hypothetical protein
MACIYWSFAPWNKSPRGSATGLLSCTNIESKLFWVLNGNIQGDKSCGQREILSYCRKIYSTSSSTTVSYLYNASHLFIYYLSSVPLHGLLVTSKTINDHLERIQYLFTRILNWFKWWRSYEEQRLEQLSLWALEERCIWSVLIVAFKMQRGLTKIPFERFF